MDDPALYSMSVTEKLTGLTRRQIRYYEAKGFISPERTSGGHRIFSLEDLDALLLIKQLKRQGNHTIDRLRRAVKETTRHPERVRTNTERVESDAAAYFANRHKGGN